ncbi:type II secretion system F family protein, partial [Bacillus cereus group sp. BC48]
VNLVINLIQRKNRSKLFVTTEKDDGKIVKFLKKKGLYKWISPNYIMRESKDFNWNLSLRDYQIILIVGTLVGAVALYGFFMSLSTTIFG